MEQILLFWGEWEGAELSAAKCQAPARGSVQSVNWGRLSCSPAADSTLHTRALCRGQVGLCSRCPGKGVHVLGLPACSAPGRAECLCQATKGQFLSPKVSLSPLRSILSIAFWRNYGKILSNYFELVNVAEMAEAQ